MIFLTFLTALALSAVSAYFSVVGMASIFPGAYWPIILMFSIIEVAKVVTISWTYRNWDNAPHTLKYPFICGVVVLMMFTSMGIFGFLSKAHLEHSADVGPIVDKVALIDEKIRIEKDNINEYRKNIKQLDDTVDQIMGRSDSERGAENSYRIRKTQSKERNELASNIESSQKNINNLNEEKAPYSNQLRKAESDFGPIKYVAELIYGSDDRSIIDKAVRLLIIMIVSVFDPLAVLLLIAANYSLHREQNTDIDEFFRKAKESAKMADESNKSESIDIPVFITPNVAESPQWKTTIEVPKDNIANIASPGVVATTYDYDEPFAFKSKNKSFDGGDF
jgi:hypothetical protein